MAVEPGEFEAWRRVAAGRALLDAAAATDPTRPAELARLRRSGSADEVRVALQLVAARRKAAAKFGDLADRLIADVEGVEQATSLDAARPKAARFARLADAGHGCPVLDLGCGVGADVLAFTGSGVPDVVAVDMDPVRAAMAAWNGSVGGVANGPERPKHGGLDVRSVVADLRDVAEGGAVRVVDRLIHLDPARRKLSAGESHARRAFVLDELEPEPAVLRRLIERSAGAAMKLSPGLDADAVRDAFGEGELCFTSESAGSGLGGARRLTQATWFTGALRESPAVAHDASRRAVVVRVGGAWREVYGDAIDARDIPTSTLGRFLVVADPAIERAGLLHGLGLPTLHPGLGLLTTDTRPTVEASSDSAVAATSPMASAWFGRWFEVLAEMPWRPAKVKRWLADHREAGTVEAVKTRGRAVDPDAALRQLRPKKSADPAGASALVVFVLRLGRLVQAIVTRPLSTEH